jgi:hypothetical protein
MEKRTQAVLELQMVACKKVLKQASYCISSRRAAPTCPLPSLSRWVNVETCHLTPITLVPFFRRTIDLACTTVHVIIHALAQIPSEFVSAKPDEIMLNHACVQMNDRPGLGSRDSIAGVCGEAGPPVTRMPGECSL